MAVVAVAAGAAVGEQLGALREGIVAQQGERARGRDPVWSPGQLHDALRGRLRAVLGGDELGIGAVLGVGEPGEQPDAGQDRPHEAEVEAVAEPPPARERHERDQRNHEPRNHDRAEDFGLGREVREPLEEEHEVPLGAGRGVGLAGVGRGSQRRTSRADDQVQHRGHHREARDGIPQGLIGPELPVRVAAVPGSGRSLSRRHPMTAEQEHMPRDQHDQRAGQHAGVQGEEAGEREMAVVRASDQRFLQGGADERSDRRDARGHLGRPVALLVPRQQVARQRQPQDDEEERQAEPEVDLAGGPVGAGHDDLHEVQDQQDHGRVGHVVMYST